MFIDSLLEELKITWILTTPGVADYLSKWLISTTCSLDTDSYIPMIDVSQYAMEPKHINEEEQGTLQCQIKIGHAFSLFISIPSTALYKNHRDTLYTLGRHLL